MTSEFVLPSSLLPGLDPKDQKGLVYQNQVNLVGVLAFLAVNPQLDIPG